MITLITGGTRSGKSKEAERRAVALSPRPTYLATATIQDEEMADRVRRHKERRQSHWNNIEEPLWLGNMNIEGQVVLLDCLTLWCTNVFFHVGEDTDKAFAFIKEQWEQLKKQSATIIIVSNEIGMGGISDNAMMRKFTDLQGWVNQFIASEADEVILMISGIPVQIK